MKYLGWLGIILGLAGGAIGIYAAINPLAVANIFMQIDPSKLATWMPIGMTIFFVVIFGSAFGPFVLNGLKNSQKKKRLSQIGVKAKATILNVQDTGITINNNPYIKVTVEIKPGTQAIFQVTVSRVQIPRIGETIQVLYDPSDPTYAMPVMS